MSNRRGTKVVGRRVNSAACSSRVFVVGFPPGASRGEGARLLRGDMANFTCLVVPFTKHESRNTIVWL